MKKRCAVCNKKLNIVFQFKCKCSSLIYCDKHRNNHNCQFDYKKNEKILLEKNNPNIQFSKIQKI